MRPGVTTQTHRTYLYYTTNPASSLDWWNPGFYEINGTEPSMDEIMMGKNNLPVVVMAGYNNVHNHTSNTWVPIPINWFETPVNTNYISLSNNTVTFTKPGTYSINYFAMSHDNGRYYAHHRISGDIYHHTHTYGTQWMDHNYNLAHRFSSGQSVSFHVYKNGTNNSYAWHAGGTYSMITITYLGV